MTTSPLIFTADQARAYALGLKWQHRVPVDNMLAAFKYAHLLDDGGWEFSDFAEPSKVSTQESPGIRCPFGAAGDTLVAKGIEAQPVIAEIRVERVQDISEADAIAEGIQNVPKVDSGMWFTSNGWDRFYSARAAFAAMWDSIHGEGSWNLNPWLWCLSFKRQARENAEGAHRGH